MLTDTTFFTLCVVLGTLAGVLLRLFSRVEQREGVYRELTKWAIERFLPVHVTLTFLKVASATSQPLELPLHLLAGGIICMFAVLASTYVVAKASRRSGDLLPHYPFIAASFAGGGRAVVLLAAAAPFIEQFFHPFLDSRLQGKGAVLDALAIFDAGYWAVYTAFVYPYVMGRAFESSRAPDLRPATAALGGAVVLVLIPALIAVFQSYVVNLASVEVIDQIRLVFAALIIIFSSTAVALVAMYGPVWQPLLGIRFIFKARAIGLVCVVGLVLALAPAVLTLVWLPMAVMLVAPPSSFVPQMLSSQGASDQQRDEAAAINLAWNVLLYALIGILALVSAMHSFAPVLSSIPPSW